MTPERHGSAEVEFPSDREVVLTRRFDAPIGLVFDVLTKPEHVRRTVAPFDEEVTICEIDLAETGGVTTMTWRLAFSDKAGRDQMTKFDGVQGNFDKIEDHLRSLLAARG